MEKFRVYAKIIGYVLPSKGEVHLCGCVLKKMSKREQKKRGFKAIEFGIRDPGSPGFYKSYITRKVFSDPRYIETQYVIYCDSDTYDENKALGIAIRLFDRVSGSLALATSSWFNKKHSRRDYQRYEYQLCKVYRLSVNGTEHPIQNPEINGGAWSMVNCPGVNDFAEIDIRLLSRLLNCKDEIFKKSFKYLLQAEQDYHRHVPPEMLTINLFKCIELIINSFSGKNFNKKLKKASCILHLTGKDQEEIRALKKARDYGDVAHPRSGSPTEFYPPQFPIPVNVDYPNFWYSGLTGKVLLNYFMYIDSLIRMNISDDSFDEVDTVCSVNLGDYYTFRPSTKERRKAIPLIKKKIAEYFGIPHTNIRLERYENHNIVFRIQDHLKFELGHLGHQFKNGPNVMVVP